MFGAGVPGACCGSAMAGPGDLPVHKVRVLKVRARTPRGPATARVRVSTPPGWTAEPAPDGLSMRLFGPKGVGKMLIAIGLRPEHLDPHLSRLRREHPGSAPTPPQTLELPQLNAMLGDRATRYPITGSQVGEMVLVERRGVLTLIAVVVRPSAWEAVRKSMPAVYRSVRVDEAP